MTQYGWTGEGIVPDHLTIVFWIDGAHGQMKLITIEEKLDKERKIKINLGNILLHVPEWTISRFRALFQMDERGFQYYGNFTPEYESTCEDSKR